ncbi:MAG TPA: hypothetical protein VJ327_01840 [Patescibacteria group bacterium]|nr:hypothetical protein [Patescibacteria group bacterium]
MDRKSEVKKYLDRQQVITSAMARFVNGVYPDDLTLDAVRAALDEVFENAYWLAERESQ